MFRKPAQPVRSLVESLESRTLLSVSGLALKATVSPKAVVNSGLGGTGSIYGTVFIDTNNNGVQEVTESSVAGATVYIDLNNTGQIAVNDPVTTTDGTGGFGFTGLGPGTYFVKVVLAPGFFQEIDPAKVIVTGNGDVEVTLIGETTSPSSLPATITGTVFNDVNQDGIYDILHEKFLAGDTVYLDTNNNGVLDPGEVSTITNNTGNYTFSVLPGTYYIRVIPRPGFHQDPPGYFTITVASGDTPIVNIGENNTATITGTLFQDLNGNGVLDPGEPGVAGETVFLDLGSTGVDNPGIYNPATGGFDKGDPSLATNYLGQFTFGDLTPGVYRIEVVSAAGFVQDTPGFVDVTVGAGQLVTANVGEGAPASISGVVYDDLNGNGTMDPGEAVLPNAQVFADVNKNGVYNTSGIYTDGLPLISAEPSALTDTTGTYTLTGLGPGTYTVRLIVPVGGQPTGPLNPGNTYTITLTPGEASTGNNFGFKTPDLTANIIKFSAAPVMAGIPQTALVRVSNVGSLPADGLVGVTLYASLTTPINLTSGAIDIGSATGKPLLLKPGQSKVIKVKFAYPVTIAKGSYYVSADVISTVPDNNTANNLSAPVGPISVTPPFVDLSLTYAAQPQLFTDPGKSTPLSLLLTNLGNVTDNTTVTLRFYATNQNVIEPTDMVVQSLQFDVRLHAGRSRIYNVSLPSPGPTLGYKYIIVVAISNGLLGEQNSANNVATPVAPTYFR